MTGRVRAGDIGKPQAGIRTLGRFAVVGGITTGIDFIVFSGLVATLLAPAPANVLSYSCGIAVSYILNRSWTFRSDGSLVRALKFVVSTLTGLLISTCLVGLMATVIPALAAKILSVPFVFVWNYLAARFWVFRE